MATRSKRPGSRTPLSERLGVPKPKPARIPSGDRSTYPSTEGHHQLAPSGTKT